MKTVSSCFWLLVWSACNTSVSRAESPVTVGDLRCEYATNPLGIEALQPRLSWIIDSDQRGQKQTAFQVLVASSEEKLMAGNADLWDTGRVTSRQSIQVVYQGSKLSSRERCYWKVRIWDKDGQPSQYSAPAYWEMGLLSPKDWRAEWIGYPAGWNGRALYFRYDIDISKSVQEGRVYIAGLGYYELHLNGARVGDHVLDPGVTDYSKRVLYATYDVGALLRRGKNAIGVIVGNGWYGMPKLLMQLEVKYGDGSAQRFYTGGLGPEIATGWGVTSGPITSNSIYDGETYDARLEKPGWDLPELGSRNSPDRTEGWERAVPVEPPGGRLVTQMINPIKIVDSMRPKRVSEPTPGVFVYDVGQNLAGWAELLIRGPRGTHLTLKFSESLAENGTVNQENLRKAAATDVYILKGESNERWEPRFTYHGFRYVQVEGFPGKPTLDNLSVKVVRSAVEPAGTFECSNDLINRIQKMIWWTEASNLYSVPTDCPQRDERMGWLNDLTVRLEESVYNFNLSRFHSKFLNDVGDTQAVDGSITDTAPFKWGRRPADPVSASYLLLAWMLYQHYGDTRAMAEHFDGFKAWVDFIVSKSDGYIVQYGSYGDWSPPMAFGTPGSIGSGALSRDTPLEFMSTGYLYYCSGLLAKMAEILGKQQERTKYERLAQQVGEAFNRKYWNEGVGGYGSNNQASNSFALFVGLVPKNRTARVVQNLAADVQKHGTHLTTGNLCTKYVLETLTENGRTDLAYQIATQETYPSWGFMLANGATTLWERWEHMTGGQMNSHNHAMMGSVSSWFHKYLGGINVDPEGPGFSRIIIRPHPVKGLGWARSEYKSMYGLIRSSWKRENGKFQLNVTVPVNASARIYVPGDASQITERGKPAGSSQGVNLVRKEAGAAVFEIESGTYEFVGQE